jgi:hypothetical protein
MAGLSFPGVRQPVFRGYFLGAASAMMGDSIEHVISYWIMFQKFQSPALAYTCPSPPRRRCCSRSRS